MELSNELKIEMYWKILLSRRLDECAWKLHHQKEIVYHMSAIGHEASQVGAAYAINRAYDWVAPYYRDLALMLALDLSPRDYLCGLMGKREDPASGSRQMPNHWSYKAANVISCSDVVSAHISHAVGIALAIKTRKEDRVVLATCGEGATSQGEWYEALNWAAIYKLPVVILVENNHYAISLPQNRQMAVQSVVHRAIGLGIPGTSVDGMNIFLVYDEMVKAVEAARNGQGPSLVEARVYRITPHSSDDDDRFYRTREEVVENQKRDPLLVTQQILDKEGLLTLEMSGDLEKRALLMVEDAVQYARSAAYPEPGEARYPIYAEETPCA